MSFILFLLFGGLSLCSYFNEWSMWITILFALLSIFSLVFFLAKHHMLGDGLADVADAFCDSHHGHSSSHSILDDIDFDD